MKKNTVNIIEENLDFFEESCVNKNKIFIDSFEFYKITFKKKHYYISLDLNFSTICIEIMLCDYKNREFVFLKNFK